MVYIDWLQACEQIGEVLGDVTDAQRKLGNQIGIELPFGLPRLVAAVRLRVALAETLDLPEPKAPSEAQEQLLEILAASDGAPLPTAQCAGEADAWIRILGLRLRLRALTELQLQQGDVVEETGALKPRPEIVASIGKNGRVYFRGGHGGGAWPDQLVVRFRRGDTCNAAKRLRAEAENSAVLRAQRRVWSTANQEELVRFSSSVGLTEDAVDYFEDVVERALDEKPIQEAIERHPELLVGLLGGKERFCIPRPRLGAEYVPDFLLGDVDSLGIRWLMVELETPGSPMTIKNGSQLENHARQGVAQIQSWREWLQSNLAYATRRRRDQGLGLVDIRPQSAGLVIVGRRKFLRGNDATVRNQTREGLGVDVHTYDWLIERLRGALSFCGPPAYNPNLFDLAPDGEDGCDPPV